MKDRRVAAAPSYPHPTDTQEPTNKNLWDDVVEVATGRRNYLTVGQRTINAPNKGRGFYPWPHPNGIAWAVKQYNGFGGNWRDKASSVLMRMAQGAVLITMHGDPDHERMKQLNNQGLVEAKTVDSRSYWDLTPKGFHVAAALRKRTP